MRNFLIIGNQNAITCKDIFRYILYNQMWLGVYTNRRMHFILPNGSNKYLKDIVGVKTCDVGGVSWFTNMEHNKRNQFLKLTKTYSNEYKKYDNFDAIEVSNTNDIPMDYKGVMGVPISFLTKYNPKQFEIIGLDRFVDGNKYYNSRMFLDGTEVYARILIKHKMT